MFNNEIYKRILLKQISSFFEFYMQVGRSVLSFAVEDGAGGQEENQPVWHKTFSKFLPTLRFDSNTYPYIKMISITELDLFFLKVVAEGAQGPVGENSASSPRRSLMQNIFGASAPGSA